MQPPVECIHPSWLPLFRRQSSLLTEIFSPLSEAEITPRKEQIFRAFENPLESVRVVIFGQDPYPGPGVADGLAFSSSADQPLPASLRNIFKEYESDTGLPAPKIADLTKWSNSGVMLLNRALTTAEGERNAHLRNGWRLFTDDVAEILGERDVVAILWGNNARELAPYFRHRVESVHPSPLSARKGFFSSRPFSESNRILRELGKEPINWSL